MFFNLKNKKNLCLVRIKVEEDAIKAYLLMKEIGQLDYNENVLESIKFIQINRFHVNDKYRKKGYGRKMYMKLREIAKNTPDVKYILVYPNPEIFPNEKSVKVNELYDFYYKIGFNDSSECKRNPDKCTKNPEECHKKPDTIEPNKELIDCLK